MSKRVFDFNGSRSIGYYRKTKLFCLVVNLPDGSRHGLRSVDNYGRTYISNKNLLGIVHDVRNTSFNQLKQRSKRNEIGETRDLNSERILLSLDYLTPQGVFESQGCFHIYCRNV
uniref:LAGLIDADG homing endonuclease n=1 Tax=Romanomermis culicivorax TaxID=13658 RepID=A0A915IT08_ROMCU